MLLFSNSLKINAYLHCFLFFFWAGENRLIFVSLAERNAGDIPFCAFCVVWLYRRCSFALLKSWVDPARGDCSAGPHPSITGCLSALSPPQCVDRSHSSSNLGSSGEDLSVCLGSLVLIQLHNTKKIGISYSVGWKSWQLKSNLPALLHRGSLACLLTHMLGFTLFDLLCL